MIKIGISKNITFIKQIESEFLIETLQKKYEEERALFNELNDFDYISNVME